MADLPSVTFRYNGIFDYERLFRTAQQFFRDRKYEFYETKYKEKPDEAEGNWRAEYKYDLYNKIVYTVDFKGIAMSPLIKDGKRLMKGKIRFTINAKLDSNYTAPSMGGKKVIFNDVGGKESWLHKVYKKITLRERSETLSDGAILTEQEFLDVLKTACEEETRY